MTNPPTPNSNPYPQPPGSPNPYPQQPQQGYPPQVQGAPQQYPQQPQGAPQQYPQGQPQPPADPNQYQQAPSNRPAYGPPPGAPVGYAPGYPPQQAPYPVVAPSHAKRNMGAVLAVIGAALFGLTFLRWVNVSGLDDLAAYLTQQGQPMTADQAARESGLDQILTNGWGEELNGMIVGILGILAALVGVALMQRIIPAIGGLFGAALSLGAGVFAFLSQNKISGNWNDRFQEGLGLGGMPTDVGFSLAVQPTIWLWILIGLSVVGVAVGVAAYATRQTVHPQGVATYAQQPGYPPAQGHY